MFLLAFDRRCGSAVRGFAARRSPKKQGLELGAVRRIAQRRSKIAVESFWEGGGNRVSSGLNRAIFPVYSHIFAPSGVNRTRRHRGLIAAPLSGCSRSVPLPIIPYRARGRREEDGCSEVEFVAGTSSIFRSSEMSPYLPLDKPQSD
jgi:hypothetical protein